jgi:hypothetical protein
MMGQILNALQLSKLIFWYLLGTTLGHPHRSQRLGYGNDFLIQALEVYLTKREDFDSKLAKGSKMLCI